MNIAALAYGRSPDYSDSECQDMANRFDVIIGADAGTCRQTIKRINNSRIILAYTNSSNCTDGDELCSYLQSQPNSEDYFLNFTSASRQDIDGSVFSRPSGSRVCSYNWGCDDGGRGTRWTTNYMTDASRQKIASFLSQTLPAYTDGWFVDNMDRGCSYSGNIQSGSAEYGLTSGSDLSGGLKMEQACNAMTIAMDKAMPADKYFINNTSNYGFVYCGGWGWSDCGTTLNGMTFSQPVSKAAMITRGTFQEFEYRISTPFPELDGNYSNLRKIWEAKGKPANHMYVMWWMAGGYDSGASDNSTRVQLYAVATHLMYQFDKSFIRYDGLDRNDTPLNGDWIGAMSANVGNAQGDKVAMDSRTYKRMFSNGIVVVRFRNSDGDNYSDSATYQLGGSYRPVNADGSLGTAVTSVTLRNAQGFIGVRA